MASVVFVADDLVYPDNSGGRRELLGGLRALAAGGHRVHLVMFHREEPGSDDLRRTALLADSVHRVRRAGLAAASLRHPLLPFQVSSRALPADTAAAVVRAAAGRVDAVIASHEWTLPAARGVAARAGDAPLVLRSHNDEVAYYAALARHARGRQRLYLRAEHVRIAALARTRSMMRGVRAVAVIAPPDAAAYAATGVPVVCIPPTFDVGAAAPAPAAARDPLLSFVGALDSPHTADGLLWFVDEVLGRLRRREPRVRLVVAGRRAPEALRRRLSAAKGVDFRGEVDDVGAVYAASRVFVNPIFAGSGVNMKVGPPLAAGVPVVSTTYGARGLGALAEAMVLADGPAETAAAVSHLLDDPRAHRERAVAGLAAIDAHRPGATALAYTALIERVARRSET